MILFDTEYYFVLMTEEQRRTAGLIAANNTFAVTKTNLADSSMEDNCPSRGLVTTLKISVDYDTSSKITLLYRFLSLMVDYW